VPEKRAIRPQLDFDRRRVGMEPAGAVAFLCLVGTGSRVQGASPTPKSLVKERVAKLRRTAASLRREANSPLPRGLHGSDLAEARRYNDWLRTSANRLDTLAAKGESILGMGGVKNARSQVSPAVVDQQSFDSQFLQLQSDMQNYNQMQTAVSNVMKTKHDTVKNSISNLR